MTDTFDPKSSRTAGDITLVVARRTGPSTLKGERIPMHADASNDIRQLCTATVARLGAMTQIAYADDLAFDPDEQYLVAPRETLVAEKLRKPRAKKGEEVPPPQLIETDPAAQQILAAASSLPELDVQSLKGKSFLFYAAVVGDDPDHRTAYVSRWNPYRSGVAGQRQFLFGDRLRRVEGTLLTFHDRFDMVLTDEAIAILSATAFEAVFRDVTAMRARIPVWTNAAADALPLDASTATKLSDLALRNARVAKQVRGMYERGALSGRFTISELKKEMKNLKLDTDRMIQQGQLVT